MSEWGCFCFFPSPITRAGTNTRYLCIVPIIVKMCDNSSACAFDLLVFNFNSKENSYHRSLQRGNLPKDQRWLRSNSIRPGKCKKIISWKRGRAEMCLLPKAGHVNPVRRLRSYVRIDWLTLTKIWTVFSINFCVFLNSLYTTRCAIPSISM